MLGEGIFLCLLLLWGGIFYLHISDRLEDLLLNVDSVAEEEVWKVEMINEIRWLGKEIELTGSRSKDFVQF